MDPRSDKTPRWDRENGKIRREVWQKKKLNYNGNNAGRKLLTQKLQTDCWTCLGRKGPRQGRKQNAVTLFIYQVKNKLLKMHSLSKLSTHVPPFLHMYTCTAYFSSGIKLMGTPSMCTVQLSILDNERWQTTQKGSLCPKTISSTRSVCQNFVLFQLFHILCPSPPFPSVVVPRVFPVPAPQQTLTSSEWREQWWEHQPRKHQPSAMLVCQSRNVCPPKYHGEQAQNI